MAAAANGWLLRDSKEELLELPDGRRKLAYGECVRCRCCRQLLHHSRPACTPRATGRAAHPHPCWLALLALLDCPAAVVMGCPLVEAHTVVMYHHGIPASLVEAEPIGEAGAQRGVAVVAFDRSGMGA